MLHVGTLIPVVIVLWKDILELFKKPFNKLLYLIIATIPAGLLGIIVTLIVDLDAIFSAHIWLLSITFTLTAMELIFAERYSKTQSMLNPINAKTSLIMGLGQGAGIFPGLSRSGTTVTFGCIAKVEREKNANFTFLMSIPIIVAAALLEGYDCISSGTIGNIDIMPLLFGVLTAGLTGYIAITFMLKIIKKANYKWFSLYLILLSVTNLIIALV
jgi:undecaprenyl-diphosphatase